MIAQIERGAGVHQTNTMVIGAISYVIIANWEERYHDSVENPKPSNPLLQEFINLFFQLFHSALK